MNSGRLRQYYAAFASGFGSLTMALLSVWPSYTLPLYISNSTTPLSGPISKMDESLLGSLPALGAVAGTFIGGPVLDIFGRRNGGALLNLPYLISWAIISVSSSINIILAARFIGGVAGGMTLVLAPIMVSETSENSIRGALASVSLLQLCVGNLMSYFFGWFFGYNTILWLNIVISVVGIALMMFAGETPVYLLRKGREEDARVAVARYRGIAVSSPIVMEEIYRLKQLVPPTKGEKFNSDALTKAEEAEAQKLNPQETPEGTQTTSAIKTLFSTPASRKAFFLVAGLHTLQIFTGMVAVQVFLSTVFGETDPSRNDLYTVIFAVIQAIGCVVAILLADKLGRRLLQISSAAIIFVCLVVLGILLQFKVGPEWLTALLTMIYCFFFTMGVGSVPYVLLAEVFVPEVLNLATVLIVEWIWAMDFVVIAIFPYMTIYFGIHGAFYSFACVSLINTVVSYYLLPETTGLSNEQIQELFSPKFKMVKA